VSDIRKTERTRLRRMYENGSYNRDEIYDIIDRAFICHIGYVFDDYPYVVPTNHWRDGDMLYWHGSSAGKKMKALRDGAKACVTFTHVDGFVMGRSSGSHSVNYRSVMMFGQAQIIDDADQKLVALRGFVETLIPGRWDDVNPLTDKDLKSTMVLGMRIDEASAKTRTGGAIDEPEDMDAGCWAGVLPIRTVIGEPIDDPELRDGITRPDYLDKFSIG
jgi:hypothetical protein